jgi:hypothetical protein
VPLLARLDKYTNILADWERYVASHARAGSGFVLT